MIRFVSRICIHMPHLSNSFGNSPARLVSNQNLICFLQFFSLFLFLCLLLESCPLHTISLLLAFNLLVKLEPLLPSFKWSPHLRVVENGNSVGAEIGSNLSGERRRWDEEGTIIRSDDSVRKEYLGLVQRSNFFTMIKTYRVVRNVRSSQIKHPSNLIKRCYNHTRTPYLYKLVPQTPQFGRDGFPSVLVSKLEYGLRRSKRTGRRYPKGIDQVGGRDESWRRWAWGRWRQGKGRVERECFRVRNDGWIDTDQRIRWNFLITLLD